jgi:8-amino-7-oxononanoate synthase
MAVATLEALAILQEEPERREQLARLVDHAGHEAQARCGLTLSGSQILPVIIGDNLSTMQIASKLRERGFDVRGVRPPAVPPDTARLRISLTLNVDTSAIAGLFDALAEFKVFEK